MGHRRRCLGYRHRAVFARLTFFFIQDRTSILRIEARRLAPKATTILQMLKLGVPIAIVQCLSLVMLVVANNAMSRAGGETALAVIGIVNAISMLLIFPIVGIAQGATALWGFNYGAGQLDRVRRLTTLTLVWTSVLGILFIAVLEIFTRRARRRLQPPRHFPNRPRHARHSHLHAHLLHHGHPVHFLDVLHVHRKAAQGGILYMAKNILSIAGMAFLPLAMGIDGVFWTGPLSDIVSTLLATGLLAYGLKTLKPSRPRRMQKSPPTRRPRSCSPPSPVGCRGSEGRGLSMNQTHT